MSTLAGCGGGETTAAVDLNALSVDEIIEKAKEDGKIESVGMPDTWANWVETWEEIEELYGIAHQDTDMSSAEEIALFKTEGEDATKDIGDVGQAFGPVAEEEGVTLKYKTSYWDSIPDWAKDDDGDWIIGYYGTMTVLVNNKIVKETPTSFEDILNGDYMVAVGDVQAATQAQFAVLAAAIAYGGDESNIDPGLEYFRKIAEQGRLDLGEFTQARIEKVKLVSHSCGTTTLWATVISLWKTILTQISLYSYRKKHLSRAVTAQSSTAIQNVHTPLHWLVNTSSATKVRSIWQKATQNLFVM